MCTFCKKPVVTLSNERIFLHKKNKLSCTFLADFFYRMVSSALPGFFFKATCCKTYGNKGNRPCHNGVYQQLSFSAEVVVQEKVCFVWPLLCGSCFLLQYVKNED